MRISNIRVLNNYKVKLINARLSAINLKQETVAEQGTRYPVVPTPPTPIRTFQEKFNIVFDYLMKRYEPGWSAADVATGKAATMALLGVSSAVNPLILGGTVEAGFNVLSSRDIGWFDPLTHPKDFATAVKAAYHVFERTRKPKKAKHRFIDFHLNGMGEYSYTRSGGNMFSNMRKDFKWYPDVPSHGVEYHGWSLAYENCVERHLLHSPYGIFRSPMFVSNPDPTKDATSWYHKQSLPWLTDRYAPNAGWVFDHYLKIRESTTLRDLLTDCSVERDSLLGVMVDGVTDTYLNTFYRGMCYPAGYYSKSYWTRDQGGYSADQVLVGSPWIPYPNGLTWIGQLTDTNSAGLCFDRQTLVMFDGSTFPTNPQVITDRPVDFTPGLSWANGEFRIQDLNSLSNAWGNSLEFIFYTGLLPYGVPAYEQVMPWMMYKDPTVSENVRYFKWRMDASMSHWKQKFKSPIDGFAHTVTDSASGIERTFHQYQPPDYMTWANIHPSGLSFVESIPVSWFRDQFNYTRGPSGPNPEKGLITGVELFAWYDWNGYPNLTFMKKSSTDTNPKLWCLDDDIAADLYCSIYDIVVGQRFNGYTLTDQLFGASAGGTLGEMLTALRIYTDQRTIDGYPFYYNTFIELKGNTLEWKGIPGTSSTIYGDPNGKIPWFHDRRFTLFYHYPIALALGGTIMDHIFDGMAYYSVGGSRFYDKNLGTIWEWDMEARSLGPVVSNFPFPNRRTPTTPPKNFWTGNARTSEFELLYCCMKAGITGGLDSLFFTELYNELEPSGATETPREGYFRALDYAVYGAAYFRFTGDAPTVVPIVKPYDNSLIFYRGVVNPGSTAGMPSNQYADYKTTSLLIPPERRVFVPIYWLVDGPPSQRQGEYFFKRTADGTTYTGSIPGVTYLSTEYGGTFTNLDTSPLKFNTPWAYVNRQVAKDSFKNFLQQSKNDGLLFSVINDDNESLNTFSLGGFYNSPEPGNQSSLESFINTYSWLEAPDARRLVALVEDPRFNGITNSITNRTLAEEFKFNYNAILQSEGQGICGASAETILGTYFTNVTNRNDFKPPWGVTDRLFQYYAWDSAIYTFCHGDLKSKIIGGSLDETSGFSGIKKYSSDLFAMNASEARFTTDLNGHRRIQAYIPGYGHEVHCYGWLSGGKRKADGSDAGNASGGIVNLYGYPPGATTDEATRYGKSLGWHPVSEGGITFGCSAYQAMIADVRRLRGILRTRPQAYEDGIRVWINGGLSGQVDGWSGDTIETHFYAGNCFAAEYYKEHFYHLCLSGVEAFNIFNTFGPVSLPNQLLIDWKNISGNTLAKPCTNATATVGATVDRIDLYEAGTNMVISGGDIGVTGNRLWRMTAPPGKIRFVKTSTTQTTLPDRIPIPANSRGVWLEAPASYGIPEYQTE